MVRQRYWGERVIDEKEILVRQLDRDIGEKEILMRKRYWLNRDIGEKEILGRKRY